MTVSMLNVTKAVQTRKISIFDKHYLCYLKIIENLFVWMNFLYSYKKLNSVNFICLANLFFY